jgi:GT2 family glycosyltransferase
MNQVLSVVIPTYNRNDLLRNCLLCLAPGAQTISNQHYEVIVTDDSKNNIAKALIEEEFPWAKWVEGPKKGPAANRNNGAKTASGVWLVFTDDDCMPTVNWLQVYYDSILQFNDSKAFEGAILPDDWKMLEKDMAECPVNMTGGAYWTANIMVNKELFESIGGFDEQFKIAAQEDQDIYLRIKKKSKVPFLESCVVIHPVRLVSLKRKIFQIHVSLESWYYLRNKYGYSFLDSLLSGFRTQYMSLFVSLRKFASRKTIYHLVVLIYYFPAMFKLRLFRQKNRKKDVLGYYATKSE